MTNEHDSNEPKQEKQKKLGEHEANKEVSNKEHHKAENKHESHASKKSHDKPEKGVIKIKKESFLVYGIAIIAAILFFIYITNTMHVSSLLNPGAEAGPSGDIELDIIEIVANGCDDCTDLTVAVAVANSSGTDSDIEKIDHDSPKGGALLEKYGITKVPAVIVTGDIEDLEISGYELVQDALVFKNEYPPFIDTVLGETRGYVTATVIKADCDECFPSADIVNGMEQIGVVFMDKIEVEYPSAEADELIETYGFTKLPAVIFSQDIDLYPMFRQGWENVGGDEADDGSFVLRDVQPLFFDIASGEVKGYLDVIYLEDASCEECYSARDHEEILVRFGVMFDGNRTVDISSDEGKELIDKYDITSVPTIILSEEASYYKVLENVWSQVGTIEEDGTFIFREIESLRGAVYKDLETGELVGK